MEPLVKEFEIHALNTALTLGIFEYLENDFKSILEIKEKIYSNSPIRNLVDFLDILHVNGHLERRGISENAEYKTAHNLFLKSNKNNMIPVFNLFFKILTKKLTHLTDTLIKGSIPFFNPFEELYLDKDHINRFLRTMALVQKNNFKIASETIDFTPFHELVDIGGCLGEFSIAVKSKYPHIQCINYDVPTLEEYFNDYMKENKMEGQISFQAGDMFKEDFPSCDVIAMGNILHDWNHEKKVSLFKKAYECLNENGIFIIIEEFIDNERKKNTLGLAISLLMFIESYQGFNMTVQEIEKYGEDAGFAKVELVASNIIVCCKVNKKMT